MNTPRVFLSHSSKDKGIVEQLAQQLRASGVDAWYDKWEIRAGQSLVDTINQGIQDCEYFVIVLSENSIASKWVREELNAAMIRRINEEAHLIPVRLDQASVPPLLAHLRYVDLNQYENGFQELLDVFFNRDTKPPLGPPPQQIPKEPRYFNLSSEALDLAEWLYNHDEQGLIWEGFDTEQIAQGLNIELIEVEDAAEELANEGLVEYTPQSDSVFCQAGLPLAIAERLNYSISADMEMIAKLLVEKEAIDSNELRELTQLEIPRLNRVVSSMGFLHYAELDTALGTAPYAFVSVRATSGTRKFVKSLNK